MSGAGRKALERAAAEAGLANLALHAGFTDATRMAWAMQQQLGQQGMSLGRQWEIEGYTLTLVERDCHPALEIRKEARLLKRVPTAVTRDYAYYLENRLRERFRLEGVPLVIDFVERRERRSGMVSSQREHF